MAFPTSAADPGEYAVRWKSDADRPAQAVVEVLGVGDDALRALRRDDWPVGAWTTLLPVHAGKGDLPDEASVPPMLGSYRVEGGVIQFSPQFPLERGVTYRAVFHPSHLPGGAATNAADTAATFRLASVPAPSATIVTEVHPSGSVLPENLLKFYVHFSAPMQRGHIYEHIHLLDEQEKPVDLPFLELDEELWNPEMTRLTLLIDPGRIKRGVRPLEEIGPALQAGKNYALTIDSAWLDATGLPLRESFRKSFGVGAADREPVDPTAWKMTPPAVGTRDPLRVSFSKPLDQALALRMIRVVNPAGNAVEGTSALSHHDERWTFTPKDAWHGGGYQLQVQKTIEDLAGNNIGKAFEVDLFEKVQPRFRDEVVSLPFEVR